MELTEALDDLTDGLNAAKGNGHTAIEIVNLEKYIAELRKRAELSAQQRQMTHAASLETFKAQTATDLEGFKSVMSAGKEAISAAILINGGAVVAMLAFIGNVIGKVSSPVVTSFSEPLILFGGGTFFAAFAFAGRYCAQFFYFHKNTRWVGHICNGATWLIMVTSYVCFLKGVGAAQTALHGIF